jgi:hypothetical protein
LFDADWQNLVVSLQDETSSSNSFWSMPKALISSVSFFYAGWGDRGPGFRPLPLPLCRQAAGPGQLSQSLGRYLRCYHCTLLWFIHSLISPSLHSLLCLFTPFVLHLLTLSLDIHIFCSFVRCLLAHSLIYLFAGSCMHACVLHSSCSLSSHKCSSIICCIPTRSA